MKRLRIILLFLLMGAIVNVAVAWGCSLVDDVFMKNTLFGNQIVNNVNCEIVRMDSFGSTLINIVYMDSDNSDEESLVDKAQRKLIPNWIRFPPPSEELIRVNNDGSQITYLTSEFDFRGWPMRCFWCDRNSEGLYVMGVNPTSGFIATPFPNWIDGRRRILPIKLIKIGFLFNTLIYASFLWLLFPGTLEMRRQLRRSRGLCTRCAYDLRGSEHDTCPECGGSTSRARQ